MAGWRGAKGALSNVRTRASAHAYDVPSRLARARLENLAYICALLQPLDHLQHVGGVGVRRGLVGHVPDDLAAFHEE